MMMSPPVVTKRQPTREKIVEIACTLMRQKGFHATTLEDIVRELGMSKGSFFHYFKTKEELGYAVIESYRTRLMKIMNEAFEQADKSPLERMNLYFETWIQNFLKKGVTGCPCGVLAQELSDRHDGFRLKLVEIFDQFTQEWTKLFEEAKACGELYAKVDCQKLAEFLVGDFQGAILLTKTTRDIDRFRRHLVHTRNYLSSLRS